MNATNENGVVSIDKILESKPIVPSENKNIHTIKDVLGEVVTKIRENIVIRRALNIETTNTPNETNIVGSYVHGKVYFSFPLIFCL